MHTPELRSSTSDTLSPLYAVFMLAECSDSLDVNKCYHATCDVVHQAVSAKCTPGGFDEAMHKIMGSRGWVNRWNTAGPCPPASVELWGARGTIPLKGLDAFRLQLPSERLPPEVYFLKNCRVPDKKPVGC